MKHGSLTGVLLLIGIRRSIASAEADRFLGRDFHSEHFHKDFFS